MMREPSLMNDVFPLTDDGEAGLLQCAHRVEGVDPRNLRHGSDSDFHFADQVLIHGLRDRGKVVLDGIANIREGFFLRRALGPASR